ncbi:hypothetical protein [Nostoc sp. ChiSLP03a]|uniref:hypothetical protein n=1 Tax=Nostoc sp. ChiSLP03a TaxID=3075380 RepID=UPI002AD37A97|nr:hypothetical protein [Nostoc sp. ChiSLP03a]MDZ8213343.1 hypothetical protein [Nostoc sp. ChiSLP03a]
MQLISKLLISDVYDELLYERLRQCLHKQIYALKILKLKSTHISTSREKSEEPLRCADSEPRVLKSWKDALTIGSDRRKSAITLWQQKRSSPGLRCCQQLGDVGIWGFTAWAVSLVL